jgi:hypothetical protein
MAQSFVIVVLEIPQYQHISSRVVRSVLSRFRISLSGDILFSYYYIIMYFPHYLISLHGQIAAEESDETLEPAKDMEDLR